MSEKAFQPGLSNPLMFRKFFASEENMFLVKHFLKDVSYFQCEELRLEEGEAYSLNKPLKNTIGYQARVATGQELRVVLSNLKTSIRIEFFLPGETEPIRVRALDLY